MSIGNRIFTWLHGQLVGHDGYGNVYYQDRRRRPGLRTRRWVMYSGEAEASKVPPEWHAWLHHLTDAPLSMADRLPWQKPHRMNLTGTPASYRPAGHDYAGGQRAVAASDYEAWTPGREA